nr:uncharacterized protein LOC123755710 isoform X2 [Procambarus clarkii]
MSSVVVPAPDRENVNANLGKKMKQHQSLAGPNKYGSMQSVTSSAQKKYNLPSGGSQSSQRSFGDISNKIGGTHKGSGGDIKKAPSQSTSTDHLQSFLSTIEKDPFPESDFFPKIKEVEDYADILPSSFHISDKHISQLVCFWKLCRLPELNSHSASLVQSSPLKDPSLMTKVQGKKKNGEIGATL